MQMGDGTYEKKINKKNYSKHYAVGCIYERWLF